MWTRFGLVLGLCFASEAALANEVEQSYGLSQTQVEGVTITRGRALKPERTFPSDAQRPATTVNLSRKYRGTVFGQHKVMVDGQMVRREQLLPIRQRDDE